jgi:hypothetical protein
MPFFQQSLHWHVFWITISVLSSLLVFYAGWVPNGDGTVFSITSGFSNYLRALDQTGRYVSCWQEGQVCFHTTRMPFVPYFHYLLSIVLGYDLLTHILVKNILAYGLTAMVLRQMLVERGIPQEWGYLIYGILYLNPTSIRILPTVGGEEGYYAHVLFYLLILLSRTPLTISRLHIVGIALAILVLTKSTLAPFSTAVALLVTGRARFAQMTLIPVMYVALALCSWSLWSYMTTGHWTHVLNISSYDGINFYKGNNPYVITLYPRYHLDALDSTGVTVPPKDISSAEWMIAEYFKSQATNYLLQDPVNTLRLLAYKAYTVFLSFVPPASVYILPPFSLEELLKQARAPTSWGMKDVILSALLAGEKLLLLASIFVALRTIFESKNKSSENAYKYSAFIFLVFLTILVTPFVIGFAYTNHMSVLYGLAWLYLAIRWAKRDVVVPKGIVEIRQPA